jgi:hypothetical protein
MFTYKESIESRRAKIEAFLTKDQSAVAVIMAAANFEWTLRRSILALGKKATAELRKEIEKTSSLDHYKKIWANEVVYGKTNKLPSIINNWDALIKAYQHRHELVHGNKGTTGLAYSKSRVEVLLVASESLNKFVVSKGGAIYGKRIRRIKKRNN